MIIERISELRGLEALEPEWRALEARLPRLPFVCYDWVHTWWKCLHADSHAVRDTLCVRAFRHGGELLGVAPLMITRRPGRGPLALRQLQFFGADPNITEIRTFAALPERTPEVLVALLEDVRRSSAEWDFMQLTGIPTDHYDCVKPNDFGSAHFVRDIPNFFLPLQPTWDEFKTRLPRNIKESLRKCYNAPKRDGVVLEHTVVREGAAVREAVGDFLRLHELRSKAEDTVKHNNVFRNDAMREFLYEVCERFAARDRLRVFQLRVGGAVIATRIGICCQDSLYLYYSGYDPAYGRYSVMTTTVAEAIQFAIREGFATVNLSTGNDVSKTRWNPEERSYRDALLVSPSLRGAAAHRAYSWIQRQIERPRARAFLARHWSRHH